MKPPLCFVSLLLLAACASPSPPAQPPVLRAMGQGVSFEDKVSDRSIGEMVRQQLNLIGAAETAAVIVEVDGGVVSLRGSATTRQTIWRAAAVARSVKGVKNVLNQILLTVATP